MVSEASPQPESNKTEKPIGLSPEDIAGELEDKREKISAIFEGLSDREASQGEQSARIRQLDGIKKHIAEMINMAQREGGMLDEVKELQELYDQIEKALALKRVK